MRNGIIFIGAAMLLAVSTSALPDTEAPRPRLTSGSYDTRTLTGGLSAEVSALGRRSDAPVWAGFAAPQIEGERRMCCWDSGDAIAKSKDGCGTCRLETANSWGFSSDDDSTSTLEPSGWFLVLFRVGRDGVNRIRTLSEECRIDPGRRPFVWLTGVDPDESLGWLAGFAGGDADEMDDDDLRQSATAAIALYRGARADRELERLAARGRPTELREQALFWMGQTRGRTGYEFLRRVIEEEPGTEVRKKAIFSMSQSPVPESTETLIGVAHRDRSSEVRGEALFWLAQKAGERAVRTLKEAVEEDPELDVKKKAVFALTQLPQEESVPLLIDIARKHRLPEVRKEAIFWLGQSGDPRALDFIEAILRS